MKPLNLRQFVSRYSPWLAVSFTFILVAQSWQTLVEGYYQKPIILKGLGGLTLSVLSVELVLLLCASLVVGIGTTLIMWMVCQARTESNPSNGTGP